MSNESKLGTVKILRINYGINRRLKGNHFEHWNGKLRIKGEWGSDTTSDRIKRIIIKRHSGWNITGWSLVNP